MSKVSNVEMSELTDLERIAIAGVVKDTQLTSLKSAMKEGTSGHVDFTVHIVGDVQKGIGSPGGATVSKAQVHLATLPIFCAVLKILGVGKDRLRRALEEIEPSKVSISPDLNSVFDEVALQKAAKLPDVKGWANGRAGAVHSQVTAEKKVA